MNISREEVQKMLAIMNIAGPYFTHIKIFADMTALLQSRLAEGEQEPVAWVDPIELKNMSDEFSHVLSAKEHAGPYDIPLFAAPQGEPK